MKNKKKSLAYLITLSENHILPGIMLLRTLRPMTCCRIVIVGNLKNQNTIQLLLDYNAEYINENEINMEGRFPEVTWDEKFREVGWYKQQFIKLCIDRFMAEETVIALDSEVFVFNNWDEKNFFNEHEQPLLLSWVPKKRKSDWDYMMYKGAAYVLQDVPQCKNIMTYANSDNYRRHISGVSIWSQKNIKTLWSILDKNNGIQRFKELFNGVQLSFSEMELYGLAAKYGLFENSTKVDIKDALLGWYDVHNDPQFNIFAKKSPMWSMCQNYQKYQSSFQYWSYMVSCCKHLQTKFPDQYYWSIEDEALLQFEYCDLAGIRYFNKYKYQLDYTEKKRFQTMFEALNILSNIESPVIVETGTLRDVTLGGGHSTYKFAEFAQRYDGRAHTVDINPQSIEFCKIATFQYQDIISYNAMDSVSYLQSFNDKIDFLYLDSFDSTPGHEEEAAQHQLEEIKAALPRLAKNCIILLDDAALPHGGKTRYSSTYLEDNGFKLLLDQYQKLYAR